MAKIRLPKPPPEIPENHSVDVIAPLFRVALLAAIEETRQWARRMGVNETLRTKERQAFLYQFGREWDDGRGIVTNATTVIHTWHGGGLAADVKILGVARPWDDEFDDEYRAFGDIAEQHGLTWGGRWKKADLPHVQWGKCPASPTDEDGVLIASGNLAALWAKYGAALAGAVA